MHNTFANLIRLNLWNDVSIVKNYHYICICLIFQIKKKKKKCCHTGMPCCRHRTWHPTLSQYRDMRLTCRSAIHWCGMLHNYPILFLGSDLIGKSFHNLPYMQPTFNSNYFSLIESVWLGLINSKINIPFMFINWVILILIGRNMPLQSCCVIE